MLRQGDAKFFKRYSQVKAQMKRALEKITCKPNEVRGFDTGEGPVRRGLMQF